MLTQPIPVSLVLIVELLEQDVDIALNVKTACVLTTQRFKREFKY